MADNAKTELKSGGLYPSGCCLALPDLLVTIVYTSTSSSDLVHPYES